MVKYYCDYCGEECDETEYELPSNDDNIFRTVSLTSGKILGGRCKKHICNECRKKIPALLELLPNTKLDENGNIKSFPIEIRTNEENKKENLPILIGYFETYKGYTGTIEYNLEDKKHYGKLLLLNYNAIYEGKDILELERDFHNVVDRYLELCGELNLK